MIFAQQTDYLYSRTQEQKHPSGPGFLTAGLGQNRRVSRSLTEDEGAGQGSQAEPGSPTDLGSGRVTPYMLTA